MRKADPRPVVGSRFTKVNRNRPPSRQPAEAYAHRDQWSRVEALYQRLAAAFERLGAWISTHQTLSLLATALVICSLLSPAILITFSPSGSFLDVSTSAITRRGRGEFVWELDGMARQGLISTEEEVCWDRVTNYYAKTGREGGGTRIRVEQILIPVGAVGTSTSSRATISKAALHRIWRVQEELERRLRANRIEGNICIRTGNSPTAGCAVLSPTGWWTDEAALLRDEDVHRTLSGRPPARGGTTLPLTLSDTFVGIGRDRQVSNLMNPFRTDTCHRQPKPLTDAFLCNRDTSIRHNSSSSLSCSNRRRYETGKMPTTSPCASRPPLGDPPSTTSSRTGAGTLRFRLRLRTSTTRSESPPTARSRSATSC